MKILGSEISMMHMGMALLNHWWCVASHISYDRYIHIVVAVSCHDLCHSRYLTAHISDEMANRRLYVYDVLLVPACKNMLFLKNHVSFERPVYR